MKRIVLSSILILAVTGLITFSSCKDEPIVPKFSSNKVGNMWDYLIYFGGSLNDTSQMKITKDLGAGKFEVISGNPADADKDTSIWYVTDTDFAVIEDGITKTVMKIDAKVNDKYTYFDIDNDTIVHLVKAINVSVTVPAGVFVCYQIDETKNSQFSGTYYVNIDAGLVKFEIPGLLEMVMNKKYF